jgi:hypothetical protein
VFFFFFCSIVSAPAPPHHHPHPSHPSPSTHPRSIPPHTHTLPLPLTRPVAEVSPAAITLTLTPHGSGTPRTARPRASDGTFFFPSLPAGSHLLTVDAPGLAYPPLWVWVREAGADGAGGGDEGAGGGGGGSPAALTVEAAAADAPTRLLPTSPLVVRPAARASPFDERARFDPVAFLKTPYGLMVLFVAFAVLVLPRLRIDPEEYEELMAEAREQRAARERERVGGGGGGGGGGGAQRAALQR